MSGTRLKTIDDLESIPDDAHRYELLRGELLRTPPGTWRHGVTLATAVSCLVGFVDEHEQEQDLGWVCVGAGFILSRDPDTLLTFDVSFIGADRVPSETEWDRWSEFAPDLAVEIVSSFDTASGLAERLATYLESGVLLVWVLDPARRTAAEHRPGKPVRLLQEDDELDGGEVLVGFRVRVGALFG